uniref:Laminin EGF-like domain-containing protein n=1 Tax=Romanomermis culicivorax TaxID=13658 RepID=A0A915JLN1_ROMCU
MISHTQTITYFYAIKEIEMGGRCVCNGHAETCDVLDPLRPSRLLCRCEHNTCGDQCSVCCPGFEQKKWQPTRDLQVFQCEPCNCFGHSEECTYDEEVDAKHQSLDIHGKYEGGGVCQNCRDNTAGINCDKCVHGYYRPYDRPLNASNVCEACRCDPHYHTGACEEGSGSCECRPNFLGPDCRQCAPGYYDFPDCKPCDCHVNGTADGVCEPQNGTCPCKSNYAGAFCDTCASGTYQFPDCIECKCEELGAVDKNCSKETGDCHCKINYGGKSCELCADGYYEHPKCSYCDCDPAGTEKEICDKNSGVCHCKEGYTGKRCDQCNNTFYGYPDCKTCECDLTGSIIAECNKASGFCECKANFTGRRCNKCSAGYYGYPQCSACNCDKFGSYGVTCNDNGQCFCKSNFDGTKCEKCKANFFNYPICEECNCDQRGVSTAFLGCDKVPIGELCICKPLVAGRICNQCKATYWNLQARNPNGCEECGCSPSGTLSGLVDCDDVSGQCQCKAHVSGRNCTTCRPGYYNLDPSNPFGCQPCNCDIGGSYSSICDGRTGQCRCKPRINNRNCSEPVEMHYFPSLTHMQYEAEDGRTPDNRAVRFAIDESLFASYSWRGYAVFSPIQDEILLTVDITKPSVYRLVFRYVNPTMNEVPVSIEFNPTQTYSHDDVKQSTETKLPVSNEPKSAYVSKNGSPYPFVLNPGRWTLHIKTKQRLLLDYVAIFPSAYFEGSVLRHDVRNPCLLGEEQPLAATSSSIAESTSKSCRQYVYPSLLYPKTTAGGLYYEEDGVKKAVPTSTDEKILAKHGQTALLDKQTPYYGEVSVMKPGNYVVVIDYSNLFETIFPVDVQINSIHKGSVNFHHCPFSEFCREVVAKDGKPVNFTSDGNPTKFQLNPTSNISVAVGGIVAIPQLDWTVDYLLPKFRCISQNGKCSTSDFLNPPNSLHFDVDPQTETFTQLSQEALPFDVANNLVNLIPLNQNQVKHIQ